jgi:hypothetical protein
MADRIDCHYSPALARFGYPCAALFFASSHLGLASWPFPTDSSRFRHWEYPGRARSTCATSEADKHDHDAVGQTVIYVYCRGDRLPIPDFVQLPLSFWVSASGPVITSRASHAVSSAVRNHAKSQLYDKLMYDVFPKYDTISTLSSMSSVLLLIPGLHLFLAGPCDNLFPLRTIHLNSHVDTYLRHSQTSQNSTSIFGAPVTLPLIPINARLIWDGSNQSCCPRARKRKVRTTN